MTPKEFIDKRFIKSETDNCIRSKQTNFERIKSMTVEEMAAWIYSNCEYLSAEYGACSGANDCSHLLKWLESEVDEVD